MKDNFLLRKQLTAQFNIKYTYILIKATLQSNCLFEFIIYY